MSVYYAEDRLTLLHGDAADLPLEDGSVDLIVTSPPYFGLRSYKDGGEHYDGQVGDEATPAEFVAALIACTREWMRVLKPEGSLWVNLGDKYNAYNGNRGRGSIQDNWPRQNLPSGHGLDVTDVRPKSLLGIPWRYAIACIDDLGLILRAEVIWSKPNGLPESVRDRVRRSHETWFHFVKQPRYYSNVDTVREVYTAPPAKAQKSKATTTGAHRDPTTLLDHDLTHNPLGKLPGSVWTIATQPLTVPADLGVDHFAAFPMEWPRRIIKGWSPPGVCVACGEGRRAETVQEKRDDVAPAGPKHMHRYSDKTGLGTASTHTITGEACGCPAPTADTRPAVVLDPFGGTGTTALVAYAHGRHGISNDLSADYCRLAKWRTTDPKQRAMAAELDPAKVPPHIDGQVTLL